MGKVLGEAKKRSSRSPIRRGASGGMLRTAQLYSEWVKLVLIDKIKSDDAMKIISDKNGVEFKRLRELAYNEKWYELSQDLLPATRALEPTSTTALEVLDVERKANLEVARKMRAKWHEGMDYLAGKFIEARDNQNTILAAEALQDMGKLSLMAERAQRISQSATCDSGSATSIIEPAGTKGSGGNHITLMLNPLMATPRIQQPGTPALELHTIPAQGEAVTNGH